MDKSRERSQLVLADIAYPKLSDLPPLFSVINRHIDHNDRNTLELTYETRQIIIML